MKPGMLEILDCPNVYYYKNLGHQKKLYTSINGKPEDNGGILVTGIPQEATVYDLALFFEQIGRLFDVKLISNGPQNKRFGYVRYFSQLVAQKAQKALSNAPFKGVLLSLHTSLKNSRIFLWGIPTDKTKNDVWEALIHTYNINNIVDVMVRQSCINSTKNKGFAILKFATHEEAVYFKVNFGSKLNLFDQKLVVDWALPVKKTCTSKADFQIRSEVKVLFLRNLPVSIDSEEFAHLVYALIGKKAVEKVFKYKDYAFVHLFTRTQAETLMDQLKENFCHTLVEVQFAKPGDKYTSRSYRDKILEQRINYGLAKKTSSISIDLTNFGSQPPKKYVKDQLEHDENYQEDIQWNKSASVGSLSLPYSASARSNFWAYPDENSKFGWFPFSVEICQSVNFGSLRTLSSECSSPNLTDMSTTPEEYKDDDYFKRIYYEDMVRKLVEDD